MSFPSRPCIRRAAPRDCTWLDEAKPFEPLSRWPPRQISKAGCWIERANENAIAQGSRDLNRTFMAFNRAEASSADWPPDRNAIPGTAITFVGQLLSADARPGPWTDVPGATNQYMVPVSGGGKLYRAVE